MIVPHPFLKLSLLCMDKITVNYQHKPLLGKLQSFLGANTLHKRDVDAPHILLHGPQCAPVPWNENKLSIVHVNLMSLFILGPSKKTYERSTSPTIEHPRGLSPTFYHHAQQKTHLEYLL